MGNQKPTRGRVFVVEDSDFLRKRIAQTVRETGQFEIVGEAASAGEAIQGVEKLRPDIVTVDLHLGRGGSGWDVIDSVGGLAGHVMILTNNNDEISRAAAAQRNVRYFFDKTIQLEEFVECLLHLPLERPAPAATKPAAKLERS